MAVYQPQPCRLTLRYREQAHSYKSSAPRIEEKHHE
jgi:hypothetical protein